MLRLALRNQVSEQEDMSSSCAVLCSPTHTHRTNLRTTCHIRAVLVLICFNMVSACRRCVCDSALLNTVGLGFGPCLLYSCLPFSSMPLSRKSKRDTNNVSIRFV